MSKSPIFFKSHHRDDLKNMGRGLSIVARAKASQTTGQIVGLEMREKVNQKA